MKAILAALFFAAFPLSTSAAELPKAVAGFIAETSGSVQIQLGGSDIWMLAKPGQRLTPGTQVKTQSGASCVIGFTEGSKLKIGPSANFKLEDVQPSKIAVFIGLGRLEAWVSKMAKRSFQARNPVAVARVRGSILAMDVLSATNATTDCFGGSWNVTDKFGNMTLITVNQRVETSATTGSSAALPLPKTATLSPEPKVEVPQNIKEQVQAEEKKVDDKKPEEKQAEKKKEDDKTADEKAPDEVPVQDQTQTQTQTQPNTQQETNTSCTQSVSPSSPGYCP